MKMIGNAAMICAVTILISAVTSQAITILRGESQEKPATPPRMPAGAVPSTPAQQMPAGAVPSMPAQQAPAMQNIPKPPVQVLPVPVIDIIDATSPYSISVRWSWNSSLPIAGFKVERKQEGGAFSEVSVTNAATRVLVETTLSANTKYTYRVRAFQGNANSPYSNEASATTQVAKMIMPDSIKKIMNAPGSVNILSTLEIIPAGVVDYGTSLQFRMTIPYTDVDGAPPGTSFPSNVVKTTLPSWMSDMKGFELPYPNNTIVVNFTSTYPVTNQGQYAATPGTKLCFRVMQDTVQVSNEACVTVKMAISPRTMEKLKTAPSGQSELPADPGSIRRFDPQPEPPGVPAIKENILVQ